MKRPYAITLAIILIGILIIRTFILIGDAKQDLPTFLAAWAVVLALLVIPGWFLWRRAKRKEHALAAVRQKEPVAYFFVPPMGNTYGIVSADKNKITVWNIKKNQPVQVAELSHDTITMRKGPVRVALLRTTDGVTIVSSTEPGVTITFALYPDKIGMFLKPLKGVDLDTAIKRLKNGK